MIRFVVGPERAGIKLNEKVTLVEPQLKTEASPPGSPGFEDLDDCFGSATAGEQKTFLVHKDVLVELSSMVKAAMANECKEKAHQEIRLPQFNPADFELFLRFAQAVAYCDPPEIGLPPLTNTLIERVLPIAAYLGADPMLELFEEHVQKKATSATIVAFDESGVRVDWGHLALSKLFAELTTASAHTAHSPLYLDGLCRKIGSEPKAVNIYQQEEHCKLGLYGGYGTGSGYALADKYAPVILTRVAFQVHACETLSKLSAHTMVSFFKYVTENRVVIKA